MVDISHPWTYPDVARAVIRRLASSERRQCSTFPQTGEGKLLEHCERRTLVASLGTVAQVTRKWNAARCRPMSKNRCSFDSCHRPRGSIKHDRPPEWMASGQKERPASTGLVF